MGCLPQRTPGCPLLPRPFPPPMSPSLAHSSPPTACSRAGSLDATWRQRCGAAAGQNTQTRFTAVYESPVETRQTLPGCPLLQHEGEVYILLAGAHVDIATVLGARSVEEGEARPEQASQHHQGVAPLRLDAPGPWEEEAGGRPGCRGAGALPCAEAPRPLGQPGPGATVPLGEGRQLISLSGALLLLMAF